MDRLTAWQQLSIEMENVNDGLIDWVMQDKSPKSRVKRGRLFDRAFKIVINPKNAVYSASAEFNEVVDQLAQMADDYMDYFIRQPSEHQALRYRLARGLSWVKSNCRSSSFSKALSQTINFNDFMKKFRSN